MAPVLQRALRRLAHPRSRRSQLWACVYSGAFARDGATESDDGPAAGAD